MSRTDRNTVIEVYALLENANESYLGLNQVLAPYRYAIVKMVLNEFESKFKVHFGIRADPNYQQIKPICRNNESMLVTDETVQDRNPEGSKGSSFSKQGYVLLLKKSFVLFEETSRSCLKQVSGFKRLVNDFASSLTRCMCVLGYKDFCLGGSFIYLPSLQKTVARKFKRGAIPVCSTQLFLNRDRYFVKLYLQFEEKLQKHIKKAVVIYCNAINAEDNRAKLLLLKHSIETCFQTNGTEIQTAEQFARYVYVLNNDQEVSYQWLCSTFTTLFKQHVGFDDEKLKSSLFADKIIWFEDVLAGILRKVIRLNHVTQEALVENLEKKFGSSNARQIGL